MFGTGPASVMQPESSDLATRGGYTPKDDIKAMHAKEIEKLHVEAAKLREEYKRHTESREAEYQELKRAAAANRKRADEIKAAGAARLAEQQRENDVVLKEDAGKISQYLTRLAEGEKRIRALEQEVKAETARAPSEPLPRLLGRLDLASHLATFEDEELDVGLLRSMGRDELVVNMAQLGLSTAEVARLADDLFPPAPIS